MFGVVDEIEYIASKDDPTKDLKEPARQALLAYEVGPLRHPMLYTRLTQNTLQLLAGLKPKLLAVMHGLSFSGNGECALQDMSTMYARPLERIPGHLN
jgi:hypothetical protein